MGIDNKPNETINKIFLKIKYSFYSTVVFFLFANPETFQIFQNLFGRIITFTKNGVPTVSGLFINTGLFFLTMFGLMLIPV